MQALDIKAEELKEKIDQLEGINAKLNALLEKIKTDMDSLEGEWISDTSAVVFDNFTKAKQEFDKLKSSRQTDFKFLNNTYENYNKMEKSIDDLVDAKIATNDSNFWQAGSTNTGTQTGSQNTYKEQEVTVVNQSSSNLDKAKTGTQVAIGQDGEIAEPNTYTEADGKAPGTEGAENK